MKKAVHKVVLDSDSSENEGRNQSSVESGDDSRSFEQVETTMEEIIFPGLIINDDYLLLKKIGFGNNAQVWIIYQIKERKYFAMKIQRAEFYQDGRREIKILKKINEHNAQNSAINTYCINMLDCFKYSEDPEDDLFFICSIYELYAGSIDALITTGIYKYGLPIPVVKRITKQLLTALSFLHDELKVIHTDIKPENILLNGVPKGHTQIIKTFENTQFQKKYDILVSKYVDDQATFNKKLKLLALSCIHDLDTINDPFIGKTESSSEESSDSGSIIEGEDDDFSEDGSTIESSSESENDNASIINTRTQSVDDLLEHLHMKNTFDLTEHYDFVSVLNNRLTSTDKEKIIDEKCIISCETALTDYGNSYFYDARTKSEIQDRRYRSPEVILDFNYGYACDIWSVGCLIFELLTGFPLFAPYDEPLTKDIHHLFLMERMLGPLPQSMKMKSKRKKFLFESNKPYKIKCVEPFSRITIDERLMKQFLFSKVDAKACSDFMLEMLKYNPSARGTATNLLNHKWLSDVPI